MHRGFYHNEGVCSSITCEYFITVFLTQWIVFLPRHQENVGLITRISKRNKYKCHFAGRPECHRWTEGSSLEQICVHVCVQKTAKNDTPTIVERFEYMLAQWDGLYDLHIAVYGTTKGDIAQLTGLQPNRSLCQIKELMAQLKEFMT